MIEQPQQVSPDGKWLWNGVQWVPNMAPGVSAGPLARPYESARFRSMFVTVFLAVNAGGLVLLILVDLVLIAAHGSIDSLDQGAAVIAGLLSVAALIVYYGSFVGAVVVFCMWLHRVVRNMPSLGAVDPRWTPGGAVVRCFIPFMNLIHPFLSVLDAWRGSETTVWTVQIDTRRRFLTPGLLIAWWVLLLVGRVVGAFSSRLVNSNDAGTVAGGALIDTFSNAAVVAAALLAIMVVRRLTARQDRKYELVVTGQLPQTTG